MDVDNSLQSIEETHGLRRLTKVKPLLLARWVTNCSFQKNKKSQPQDMGVRPMSSLCLKNRQVRNSNLIDWFK